MNKEFILEKWIPALRSGNYKQGTGVLHRENRYCCLGVACELLMNEGLLVEWKGGSDYYTIPGGKTVDKIAEMFPNACDIGHSVSAILPSRVAAYLDVPVMGPFISFKEDEEFSLVSLNDTGTSFEEIANLLEDHVNQHEGE